MKIVQGNNPIKEILDANPDKKIGKLSINYNKINDTELSMHAGHKYCISELRAAGCEIIILEFINTYNMYRGISEDGRVLLLVNQEKVLELCELEEIDIDYVIYDALDLKAKLTPEFIKLVDDRLQIENYRVNLNIPDDMFKMMRAVCLFATRRKNSKDITMVRSYKNGSDTFAIQHYLKKYLSCDLLVVKPLMIENTNIPYSTFTDFNPDAEQFRNYFYSITKQDLISDLKNTKLKLQKYASGLNVRIDNLLITKKSEFVGENNVLIALRFRGMFNTSLFFNNLL